MLILSTTTPAAIPSRQPTEAAAEYCNLIILQDLYRAALQAYLSM